MKNKVENRVENKVENLEIKAVHSKEAAPEQAKAVITVIGIDKAGIIAEVSAVLYKCNVNILDITQTTMQEYFTMIMLVDLSGLNVDYAALATELEKVGEKIGLKIQIQHQKIFNSMHRI